MKKNLIAILLSIFLILPNLAYANEEIDTSELSAALLADYETGDIIYSSNLKRRIEVASITKIMTYVVAMDQVKKGKVSLDDKVIISEKAAKRGGSSFKLKPEQVHTLGMLLESSMIASANDACIAIAEHVSENEKEFTKLMNEKARELNLDRTYYVSVNGFPEEGTHNTMSVEDILKLTAHTIEKYPEILKITSKTSLIDNERGFEFINTNPLLGQVEGVNGFKTGYADEAGYCLVTTRISKDSKLISIVMGAGNKRIRTEKSRELIDGKLAKDYNKEKVLDKNKSIDNVFVPGSANGQIDVYAKEDMYGMIKKGEKIDKTTNIYNHLNFPVKKGETIGEVTVEYNGNTKTMELIANEDLKQEGLINTLVLAIRNFLAFAS